MNFRVAFAVAALLLGGSSSIAAAQLRPLEPTGWWLLDAGRTVAVEAGGAVLADQRVSRTGSVGTLYEAGQVRAFWRTGRVLVEAGGTVQRFYREERVHDAAGESVQPADDGWRRDTGDYVVATTVLLNAPDSPLLAVLRFGTRLPTTDNEQGLERDRTDFFALAGARFRRGRLLVGAEAGVSINGTREQKFEQKDVLAYTLSTEYAAGSVVPGISVTGDVLGPRRMLRGNEPLGEFRAGFRTAGRRWVRVEAIAGYRTYSPRLGVRVSAGMTW
ncbi:MAG TPA: hypothetical protein VK936_14680 [Longimicrobiales bacterium]|nr:hypothetical protein [Longimicrobiales bacterium]